MVQSSHDFQKWALACLLFWVLPLSMKAQKPQENLEKAIENYNALIAYKQGIDNSRMTDEVVNIVTERVSRGVTLLNSVLSSGSPEEVKTALYFKANAIYQLAHTQGSKGDFTSGFNTLKEVYGTLAQYQERDFPMRYVYFGKNYIINWKDFVALQAEIHIVYGEFCFRLNKNEEAAMGFKKGLANNYSSYWYKYTAVVNLTNLYEKMPQARTAAEYYDCALNIMRFYAALDERDRTIIKEKGSASWVKGYNISNRAAESTEAEPTLARYLGEAAHILAAKPISDTAKAQVFYTNALKKGWGQTPDYQKALDLALASKDKVLGVLCLDKLAPTLSNTDCEGLETMAKQYRSFGGRTQALAIDKRAETCLENRKKQADEQRRAAYRRDHPFNLYVGLDLFPLLTKSDKRDIGLSLDLRGARVSHSFGYAWVKKKSDFSSKAYDWDGYKASYGLKFFGNPRNNEIVYSGLFMAYALKTFESVQTTITTNGVNSFRALTPVDRQIELMWLSGLQSLSRIVGSDIYFGIGASYNTLSYKEADIKASTFSDNDFVENRQKEKAFFIKMRLGMNVGFNLGRPRLK